MPRSLGATLVLLLNCIDDRAERCGERSLCSPNSRDRASLAELLLLVLVLIEPLTCVAYCQSWAHLWPYGIDAAQHQADQLQVYNGVADELAQLRPVRLSNPFICIMGAKQHTPSPAAPTPTLLDAHRAAATASTLVMQILILQAHQVGSSLPLPHRSYRPLLPPPIAIAT